MGFKAKFSNGGFKYEVPQEKKLGVKSRLVINTFYAGTAVAIPNITALDYLRLRILTNTASIQCGDNICYKIIRPLTLTDDFYLNMRLKFSPYLRTLY